MCCLRGYAGEIGYWKIFIIAAQGPRHTGHRTGFVAITFALHASHKHRCPHGTIARSLGASWHTTHSLLSSSSSSSVGRWAACDEQPASFALPLLLLPTCAAQPHRTLSRMCGAA
jgi:hypothetical protein